MVYPMDLSSSENIEARSGEGSPVNCKLDLGQLILKDRDIPNTRAWFVWVWVEPLWGVVRF